MRKDWFAAFGARESVRRRKAEATWATQATTTVNAQSSAASVGGGSVAQADLKRATQATSDHDRNVGAVPLEGVACVAQRLPIRYPTRQPARDAENRGNSGPVAHVAHVAHESGSTSDTHDASSPDTDEWRERFDERASIVELDGQLSRAEAEVQAFEECVIRWMNQSPPPWCDPRLCAQCNKPFGHNDGVPYLTGGNRHVWLHHRCHSDWRRRRRNVAVEALVTMGLPQPEGWEV